MEKPPPFYDRDRVYNTMPIGSNNDIIDVALFKRSLPTSLRDVYRKIQEYAPLLNYPEDSMVFVKTMKFMLHLRYRYHIYSNDSSSSAMNFLSFYRFQYPEMVIPPPEHFEQAPFPIEWDEVEMVGDDDEAPVTVEPETIPEPVDLTEPNAPHEGVETDDLIVVEPDAPLSDISSDVPDADLCSPCDTCDEFDSDTVETISLNDRINECSQSYAHLETSLLRRRMFEALGRKVSIIPRSHRVARKLLEKPPDSELSCNNPCLVRDTHGVMYAVMFVRNSYNDPGIVTFKPVVEVPEDLHHLSDVYVWKDKGSRIFLMVDGKISRPDELLLEKAQFAEIKSWIRGITSYVSNLSSV